ncbi:PP2C family protein-serine/threonine phosphatase [Spirosoma oryzicola]|uniref:PP2C family protein-serine/threonine phosphatase n=1 Tax=Spirosoma oryzicola TaxID=2898794 RepID=UPI001E4D9835|nr:protein phosphatase 2C domain-containing protein [Spirosoma oryzicola]UHG91052.1 protein phosphatase 2C domain-containing protein [Spirosoma oryzicola]
MFIHPSLPLAFSHIGQRTINQDTLYPAVGLANEQTQLFIVCDGMGGADKGEIASQLLCEAVARYASSLDYPVFDAVHLKTALDMAYQAYTDYLGEHPFVSRMGSTLALLQLHQQGVTAAHIGDSRIYQVRAGKIVFQTQDHKQVNDMVEAGIITATQALTHPWRNRLSRAVVASSDKKETKSVPDSTVLTDVREGDYFFMCTDGALERLDEYALETVLAQDIPDMAKLQALLSLCDGHTKDNYSGYLIGVKQVTQQKSILASIFS